MAEATLKLIVDTKADTGPLKAYQAQAQTLHTTLSKFTTSDTFVRFGAMFQAGKVSVESLIESVKGAIGGSSELASSMKQVERRTILSGEAVQVFAKAGKMEFEELLTLMGRYRVKLGEALLGNKEARGFFDKIGLAPEELSNMSGAQQMEMLAGALGQFEDANIRAAIAQEVFGRGSAAMIPLLDRLRTEGYGKLYRGVSDTAGVLSGEMAAALGAAKKHASDATSSLTISLAQTNLKLLEMKANVMGLLASYAGPIQSAGTGVAFGLTGMLLAKQLSSGDIGAKINVLGSQAAQGFTHGFGAGLSLLPSVIMERFAGGGMMGMMGSVGSMLATPFGAAFAVALGGMIIEELKRLKLDEIVRERENARATDGDIKRMRDRVHTATSKGDLDKVSAELKALIDKAEKTIADIGAKKSQEKTVTAIVAKRDPITGAIPSTAPGNQGEDLALQRAQELIVAYGNLRSVIASRGAVIAQENKLRADSATQAALEAAELEKTSAKREANFERERTLSYDLLQTDQEKLAYLREYRTEEQDQYTKRIEGAKDAALKADLTLERRIKTLEIDKQIAEVQKRITDEAERARKEGEKDLEDYIKKYEMSVRQSALDESKARVRFLSDAKAELEGDFTRTEAEKYPLKLSLINQEIELRRKQIAQLQELKADSESEDAKQGYTSDIEAQGNAISGLQNSKAGLGPAPDSFGDQAVSSMTRLMTSWGTMAQQMGSMMQNVIGGAVNSISAGLTGLIMKTATWREVWQSVATTILTTVIQSIIQMGVRWVLTQIMMATFSKAMLAASVLATAPLAIAQAAIWASPATLATIATFGGAAAAAPGFIGISKGVVLAEALTGFETGGWTGGRRGMPAGIVHGEEIVFSAPAVDALGRDNLLGMHASALSGGGGSSSSSGNSSSAAGKPTRFIHVQAEDIHSARKMAQDPDFDNVMIDWARRNKGSI
jgi:hypothetical protein